MKEKVIKCTVWNEYNTQLGSVYLSEEEVNHFEKTPFFSAELALSEGQMIRAHVFINQLISIKRVNNERKTP